ncbi:MAG: hypothetical protein NZ699_08865 [Roseiflexus sp.]|nr:hypothetical protein [Roseiflexus sp.]MCS7289228.1 hypothetical protein [Roseiflexus sp.]MDW8146711.1 hypothetical protein [Roseiflexaceae bacterium]
MAARCCIRTASCAGASRCWRCGERSYRETSETDGVEARSFDAQKTERPVGGAGC